MILKIKNYLFILSVIALICFITASFIVLFSGLDRDFKRYCNIEKTYDAADAQEIIVNTKNVEIKIIDSTGDKIKFHLYGLYAKSAIPEINTYFEKNIFHIILSEKIVINLALMDLKNNLNLDLYIPQKDSGCLKIKSETGNIIINSFKAKTIDIESFSGNIYLSDLESDLTAKNVNGKIFLNNINSKNVYCSNISENISAGSITANNFDIREKYGNTELENIKSDIAINSVNGSISCELVENSKTIVTTKDSDFKGENILSKKLIFNSEKGSLNLNEFSGNIQFASISGDLTAKYLIFDNSIDINTQKGKILLILPEMAQFKFKFKSETGYFTTKFNLKTEKINKPNDYEGFTGKTGNIINILTKKGNAEILQGVP